MMTDVNGALFPLAKNFLGTVKDPAWMVSRAKHFLRLDRREHLFTE